MLQKSESFWILPVTEKRADSTQAASNKSLPQKVAEVTTSLRVHNFGVLLACSHRILHVRPLKASKAKDTPEVLWASSAPHAKSTMQKSST